jgi:chorismate mutase
LRKQIAIIDKTLLQIITARNNTANQIGKIKKLSGLPIRNIALEKRNSQERHKWAKKHSLSTALIDKVWRLLIAESVRIQKEVKTRIAGRTARSGKSGYAIGLVSSS